MDEMTSGEFRKRYPKLKEPVAVTVLGRPIGVWLPGPIKHDPWESASDLLSTEAELHGGGTAWMGPFPFREAPPVHVAPLPAPRPFTPAPKPGKR